MSATRNQKLILALLVATVVLGFTLRTYWNMDAAQLDDGTYLLSGNDPYYHKHAVDLIVEDWKHPRFDPMLNYPMGAINPNPPLFEWSIAVDAHLLEPMVGDQGEAVWLATLYAPAIWGALTIIPVFLIARMFAGPWAGLLAAFLLATSPEHMSRTNLGFADHDAMVIFLAVFGFYFLMRALGELGDKPEHVKPNTLATHYRSWFMTERRSSGSALLAGTFWGALALTWKGFPYVFGVVIAYAAIQFLFNHWRNRDVARPLFVLLTALGIATLLGLPYYAGFGLLHFWNPALFLVIVLAVMGVFFVATQEYPSILVVPGLLVIGAVFALIMFVLVPDIAQALLNRLVYFRQTNLYTTIAEAHPSDISSLAFSVGPIPFFLYLLAFPWLIFRFWQDKRGTDLFFLTWGVVDLYLAISAVRFLSQSVPTMAILGACATVWTVRLFNLSNVVERYRASGGGWRGIRRSTNVMQVLVVLFVAMLVVAPNLFLGVDAAVPSNIESQKAREARQAAVEAVTEEGRSLGLAPETIQEFQQLVNASRDGGHFRDLLQESQLRLGLDNDLVDQIADAAAPHLKVVGTYQKRLGAFGANFLPSGWRRALTDLSERDTEKAPADRPGFLAWWDYGHWAIAVGKHPAVADNFQNGYHLAGSFITAKNESHAIQLLAARHVRLIDQATYVDTLTDRGLPKANATRAYENHRVNDFTYVNFEGDELQRIATSAAWLRDIEAITGKMIRYVAFDNRMLPVDNPNTRHIDSPSIFYAPATLAGQDPRDYVEDVVVNMQTGQTVSDAELRALQRNPDAQPDLGQRLDYKPAFFQSMFYRGFMGLPVNEPIEQQGQTFPVPFDLNAYQQYYQDYRMFRGSSNTVTGAALSNEVAPGFGFVHFRLIYANEAVRMLEYFPGAVLEGTVALNGEPVEGVRVTAFDDAGEQVLATNPGYFEGQGRNASQLNVPHDSTLTDADGRYRLVAPFGSPVTVKVTQETARGAPGLLATDTVEITRAQSEAGQLLTLDLDVEPAGLEGIVYLDENQNNRFDDGEQRLENATIVLQDRQASTGTDGAFAFSDLAPGSYTASVTLDGFRLRPGAGQVSLTGGDTTERNFAMQFEPIQVSGEVEDAAGELVEGVRVEFLPQGINTTAQAPSTFSQINGTIAITLQPGTYQLNGTGQDAAANQTLTIVGVEVVGGTGASVNDAGHLVLEPRARNVQLRVLVERS